MARVSPLDYTGTEATPESRAAVDEIRAVHGRVTNMKRTLARSSVALHSLMTWYDLRAEVVPFLGERLTTLFAHAISAGTDCLVCSTFFRRLLIDAGENPDSLQLDEWEQTIVTLRPAARSRPAWRLRRTLRAVGGSAEARSDRCLDSLRRAHGRDESVQ